MINDKLKCIFVEVPKTGSTSVRSIIGNPNRPHKSISEIKFIVNKEKFESYFKFGFVRNPWDRVVSLYERNEGQKKKKIYSFIDFVKWIKFASSTCVNSLPHRNQLDWLVDHNGEISVDFIGRFEKINHDWDIIQEKIGTNIKLPILNKNANKKHYTEYYDDETKTIIYEKFSIDIEFFNYKFV